MKVMERVQRLRQLLKDRSLDAYVVPSADPHQSSYVAGTWNRREYISGFTGSAGLFACTQTDAGLWTDGRYFLQGEAELAGTGIALQRQGIDPDWMHWALSRLEKGNRVGVNLSLFSARAFEAVEQAFQNSGIEIVPIDQELVDTVWGKERPQLPQTALRAHPAAHAGRSHQDKLQELRAAMSKEKAEAVIVSVLDEVAWLFNLRGSDTPNQTTFYAYAIIQAQKALLFTDPRKVSADLQKALGSDIEVLPYESFETKLRDLKGPVWMDPGSANADIKLQLERRHIKLFLKETPIAAIKAKKNPAELSGMKAAHVRDGVALVKFFAWLKEAILKEDLNEVTVADRLLGFRKEAPEFLYPSFSTIAGYGEHGAIVHYRAKPETAAKLKAEGVFLLDSGGQYVDGTTDVTRTITLGAPSDFAKRIYTSVLKGHLLLARSYFPAGTNGYQLDVLARQPLWKELQDYNHGTGHGVGAALNVHEGPFSVSKGKNLVPLAAGHILSNEPGCYLAGDFGVRIENLVTVVKKGESTAFGDFLGFEDLTLCPYDRQLIDTRLLSPEDKEQVNAYHQRVYRELSPLLQASALDFLKQATAPLT